MVYTPNIFIEQDEINKVINSYYNNGCILRNPVIVLENNKINNNQGTAGILGDNAPVPAVII